MSGVSNLGGVAASAVMFPQRGGHPAFLAPLSRLFQICSVHIVLQYSDNKQKAMAALRLNHFAPSTGCLSRKNSAPCDSEMKKRPELSAKELAASLGKTSRTIERHIKELREQGIFVRVGADRGGHWEMKDSRPA